MLALEATFVGLGAVSALAWGLLAARAGGLLRGPRAARLVNRAGGSCLIGAGVVAAVQRA
jgi:threonine/homoserine/homoserine lactone efflux protein